MKLTPIKEEPFDALLYRPLARGVVRILLPTPVTANQVSLFAGILGVLSGICIVWGTPEAFVAAIFLLMGHMVFDCADGELARKRGGGGKAGQVVDGLSDYFVAVAIHLGLLLLVIRFDLFPQVPGWGIFIVLFLCGVSMAIHSALFDAAKQRFRVEQGGSSAWAPSSGEVREEYSATRSLWDRIILFLYGFYSRSQAQFSGWVSTPRPMTQTGFLAWTILGPSFRSTTFCVVLVLAMLDPRALLIYPVFSVLFANLWLAVLMIVGRVIPRRPSPAGVPGSGPLS